MPNEIDRTSSAQRRSSKLLTAMAIFICLGIAAYMVLTLFLCCILTLAPQKGA